MLEYVLIAIAKQENYSYIIAMSLADFAIHIYDEIIHMLNNNVNKTELSNNKE